MGLVGVFLVCCLWFLFGRLVLLLGGGRGVVLALLVWVCGMV